MYTLPWTLGERELEFQGQIASEVAWYRLAQVQRALGSNADAEKATGRIPPVHAQRVTSEIFSPHEVTKQEFEPKSDQ
jgi:hypothetical protein